MKGALVGKVGSVFVSTGTQRGGQETIITSFHSMLLHSPAAAPAVAVGLAVRGPADDVAVPGVRPAAADHDEPALPGSSRHGSGGRDREARVAAHTGTVTLLATWA